MDWKAASTDAPTQENYQAQIDYYDRLWQQNQDAIVNGLGNGTLEQGSGEWYALFKKGDDLLAMKDAYNRGMMGQLDGQKAQTAEEQAEQTATSSRGRRSTSLDTDDEAAYTRGAKPGMDDEIEPQSVFPSQNKPSKEDELKTALEDKYNQILGMTDEQKSAFICVHSRLLSDSCSFCSCRCSRHGYFEVLF